MAHFYIIYPHGALSASGELIGNPVKVSLGCAALYIYVYIHIYPRAVHETFLVIFGGKIRSCKKS